ncbi:hypothetical protein HMPREF3038_00218, partial [Akkermansia sp. KLE1797]
RVGVPRSLLKHTYLSIYFESFFHTSCQHFHNALIMNKIIFQFF